jgi:hypothetical protein
VRVWDGTMECVRWSVYDYATRIVDE